MWKHFFLKANTKIRFVFSLISSAYIIIFSYFLEPLKNETINYDYPLYYNLIGMLACFSSISLFSIVIPILFSRFFSTEKWTFNRFIIWFLGLCIATAYASYLFDAWAYQLPQSSFGVIQYVFSYQIFIDFFIASSGFIFFLYPYPQYKQSEAIKNFEIESINNSSNIDTSIHLELNPIIQILRLNSQNKHNNIEIPIEQLYYISSANNYVEIFYEKDNGHLNRHLLRSTLKNIEEQNQNLPMLFRCHKAFIVNSQKIKSIKGNTKGYSLTLENVDDTIPVSRQKNQELEKRFPYLL